MLISSSYIAEGTLHLLDGLTLCCFVALRHGLKLGRAGLGLWNGPRSRRAAAFSGGRRGRCSWGEGDVAGE